MAKINLGLNVGKNKSGLFFLDWATNWAQSLNGAAGPVGPGWGGSGPREKTRYPKQGGSGPRVLPRRSGPGMKKPGPNPTRCHSYLVVGLLLLLS